MKKQATVRLVYLDFREQFGVAVSLFKTAEALQMPLARVREVLGFRPLVDMAQTDKGLT